MNHASLCITKTRSCAYFEELSNDMGEWCNVLSQSCIHVVCNGVCSRPNSCDLSCLQSTLQANPGCAAQQDVLDSSPWSWWDSRLAETLVTHDQCSEMIPDNDAYVSRKNAYAHNWRTREIWNPFYIISTYRCHRLFSDLLAWWINMCVWEREWKREKAEKCNDSFVCSW